MVTYSVTATMGGTTVGATIDNAGMLILAAPAVAGMVTVVVTASDDAEATATVEHDDVSHTYIITV